MWQYFGLNIPRPTTVVVPYWTLKKAIGHFSSVASPFAIIPGYVNDLFLVGSTFTIVLQEFVHLWLGRPRPITIINLGLIHSHCTYVQQQTLPSREAYPWRPSTLANAPKIPFFVLETKVTWNTHFFGELNVCIMPASVADESIITYLT